MTWIRENTGLFVVIVFAVLILAALVAFGVPWLLGRRHLNRTRLTPSERAEWGGKLLDELRAGAQNRGEVFGLRSYWKSLEASSGIKLSAHDRYVILHPLLATRVLLPYFGEQGSDDEKFSRFWSGWLSRPLGKVILSDRTFEELIAPGGIKVIIDRAYGPVITQGAGSAVGIAGKRGTNNIAQKGGTVNAPDRGSNVQNTNNGSLASVGDDNEITLAPQVGFSDEQIEDLIRALRSDALSAADPIVRQLAEQHAAGLDEDLADDKWQRIAARVKDITEIAKNGTTIWAQTAQTLSDWPGV